MVATALVFCFSGVSAHANVCARDVVPAASLLVPYAVVDLNPDGTPNPFGYTTLLAVTNVAPELAIVHVTVWDAKANHVACWDEVLTGYDVVTINFRDVLTGHFDAFDTGHELSPDPAGGPPPFGPTTNIARAADRLATGVDVTQQAIAGCGLPYGFRPSTGPVIVQKLQDAIHAQTSQNQRACPGGSLWYPRWLVELTASPVFFYVTADVVAACTSAFPDEEAYWTGGPASNGGRFPLARNVIIGDVIWVNAAANYSESIPAVHLEADPAARTLGLHAFYGRYANSGGSAQQDDREPLGTAFALRYLGSVADAEVIVWKDSVEADGFPCTASGSIGTTCGCQPYIYYAFDNDENALVRGGGACAEYFYPHILPFATQSAPLDWKNWDGLPSADGWMLLVFDPSVTSARGAATTTTHQAWVGVRYLAGGYSTAHEAATAANTNCFPDQVLPRLGINVGAPVAVRPIIRHLP